MTGFSKSDGSATPGRNLQRSPPLRGRGGPQAAPPEPRGAGGGSQRPRGGRAILPGRRGPFIRRGARGPGRRPQAARRYRGFGRPRRAGRRPWGRGSRSLGALSAPRALGAASSFLRRGDAGLSSSRRKAAFLAGRPPVAKDGAHRPTRDRAAAAFVLGPFGAPPPGHVPGAGEGAPAPDPQTTESPAPPPPRTPGPGLQACTQDPRPEARTWTPDPGAPTPGPEPRTSAPGPAEARGVLVAPARRTPPGRGRKTRSGSRVGAGRVGAGRSWRAGDRGAMGKAGVGGDGQS